MSELNNDVVEAALKTYEDPYLETDLVSAKSINNIAIDGGAVTVDVVLGFPAQGYSEELSSALSEKIDAVDGVTSSTVNVSWDIVSHAVQKGVPAVKGEQLGLWFYW